MPQASDELRAYWGGTDPKPAIDHLYKRGYELTGDWNWVPPKGLNYANAPIRDWKAIDFLIQEWDYGGLTEKG